MMTRRDSITISKYLHCLSFRSEGISKFPGANPAISFRQSGLFWSMNPAKSGFPPTLRQFLIKWKIERFLGDVKLKSNCINGSPYLYFNSDRISNTKIRTVFFTGKYQLPSQSYRYFCSKIFVINIEHKIIIPFLWGMTSDMIVTILRTEYDWIARVISILS
jgi:hypothetical protein